MKASGHDAGQPLRSEPEGGFISVNVDGHGKVVRLKSQGSCTGPLLLKAHGWTALLARKVGGNILI